MSATTTNDRRWGQRRRTDGRVDADPHSFAWHLTSRVVVVVLVVPRGQ